MKINIYVLHTVLRNLTTVVTRIHRSYGNKDYSFLKNLTMYVRVHARSIYARVGASIPKKTTSARHHVGDVWSITVTIVEAAETCSQKWVTQACAGEPYGREEISIVEILSRSISNLSSSGVPIPIGSPMSSHVKCSKKTRSLARDV